MRSIYWRLAAVLWVIINAGGAMIAVGRGEPMHAIVHVAFLAGGFVVWQAITRRSTRQGAAEIPEFSGELSDNLTHLQQSVDVVALEVERIGEGQRFINRRFTEKGVAQPSKEAAPDRKP
jgi:hypothetical protein